MEVHLDPDQHLLKGESTITYANNSPDTLDSIYLHLYPNAFQEGSVKYREFQRVRFAGGISQDNPSYIEVLDFEIAGENGLLSSDFKIDDSILSATLPQPAAPGDTLVVTLSWEHKIRERAGRMGYSGEQYDMAQWYPKMVVYDDKGWHNVPFHAIGEFYGEFGDYDVTIGIPEKYIVGATGVVVQGDPGWTSVSVDTAMEFSEWLASRDTVERDSAARRIVTFHGEDIHDFAWIASPTFVYEPGEWNGIDVHVLYNASVGEKWTRVVRERSERALEWLSTRFGPYPYPQVTVTHAMRGGGMEYPMLVMNGTESEGLIVHEIGHIWFYGILGNNEVDEPWLDEGFTTFQTRWYLEDRYPPYGLDLESSSRYNDFQKRFWSFNSISERSQWSVIRFMTSGHDRPIATKSYHSPGYNVYRQNAYTKPSLMLQSLRSALGEEVFDEAMKTYYARWKLKHPNEKRFRDTMEEVSGQDLDWFFDSWLHSTFQCDYALKGWKKKRLEDGSYEVTATIVNRANMFYPLEIDVALANGDTFRTRWTDYLWRWKDEVTFAVPSRPERIVLDPDNETLDMNLLNNSSGLPPYRVVFNWPGMAFSPRDGYALKWNPLLWYHKNDGLKPGLSLLRTYGHWTRLEMSLTAGVKSKRVHGKAHYSKSLSFFLPSLTFSASGYSLEGVRGAGLDLDYRWNRYYGYPPHHTAHFGLYVTDADGTDYTDLYESGTVTVFYGKYAARADLGQFGGILNLGVFSAPGGLGDWTFARLVSDLELRGRASGFSFAGRFIAGYSLANSGGLPVQEKFTVHGAGSGDYFSKPYLRHSSSMYNIELGENDFLRNHFHLYGDANLRGYYEHGFEGAENLVAATAELSRSLPIPVLNSSARLFFDGGWLWSEVDNLDGQLLTDSGFGFTLRKRVIGADLKFRIDFPFWLNTEADAPEGIRKIDFSRWVFGFDAGLP
ncbi:MAG: M1 family metallopeptidase [Candidatus Neomarinimicrobiota bacterium]